MSTSSAFTRLLTNLYVVADPVGPTVTVSPLIGRVPMVIVPVAAAPNVYVVDPTVTVSPAIGTVVESVIVPVACAPLAVRVSEFAPLVILAVWPLVGCPVKVPVALASLATGVTLVLKTAKSFVQSGAAFTSKLNFAGNIPSPTVPFRDSDILQSR